MVAWQNCRSFVVLNENWSCKDEPNDGKGDCQRFDLV